MVICFCQAFHCVNAVSKLKQQEDLEDLYLQGFLGPSSVCLQEDHTGLCDWVPSNKRELWVCMEPWERSQREGTSTDWQLACARHVSDPLPMLKAWGTAAGNGHTRKQLLRRSYPRDLDKAPQLPEIHTYGAQWLFTSPWQWLPVVFQYFPLFPPWLHHPTEPSSLMKIF